MFQVVLEFLEAIRGEGEKKPDAFIGVLLRVANFVCLDGSEIVLLRRNCGRHQRSRHQHEGTQYETHFQFHGCFSAGGAGAGLSAGGATSCFSKGRRGKSIFNSSSSMETRSWRTICSGGL